jgi:ATP-binding cassette subfamily B protein
MITIKVKQSCPADSGLACICSISVYYGIHFPISEIRRSVSTCRQETRIKELIVAAQTIGLKAIGVRCSFKNLCEISLPCIAHFTHSTSKCHFVVIYRFGDKKITIMDPVDGKLHIMTHLVFKEEWSGILILICPDIFFQKKRRILIFLRFSR